MPLTYPPPVLNVTMIAGCTTSSPNSPAAAGAMLASPGLLTSLGVWPSANRAIYMPVLFDESVFISRLMWFNGAAVAGNVDVGVYASDANGLPSTRLSSLGSTAQAGTTAFQVGNIADVVSGAGLFYMAMACSDGTTAQFCRSAITFHAARGEGVCQEASAFPLPATATPVGLASNSFLPSLWWAGDAIL